MHRLILAVKDDQDEQRDLDVKHEEVTKSRKIFLNFAPFSSTSSPATGSRSDNNCSFVVLACFLSRVISSIIPGFLR